MKKYLSLFLVLVMLVTSMPVYAFAEGMQDGEEIAAVAETTEESAEEKPAEDTKEEKEPEPEPVKEEPVEEKAEEKAEEEASKEEPVQPASETEEEEPAPAKEEAVTEEEPAEEPVKEEPVEEAPVEETPAEETPAADEAVIEEEPAEETPVVDETVTEEEPAEETPVVDETVTEEVPTEEIPAEDETVTEGENAEETPAEGDVATEEEVPAEEEIPAEEETPAEGAPIDADGDGVIDGYDMDGDGVIDVPAEQPAEEETDEIVIEGTPMDIDGDGVIDGYDVDGDGVMDLLADGTEVPALDEGMSEEELEQFNASYPYVSELRLAEQTDRSATLKWDDLKEEDAYLIEYIDNSYISGSNWSSSYIKEQAVDADETTCTIEGLEIGKSYRFRIRAWYDNGTEKGQYSEPTVLGDDVYLRPYEPKNLIIKTVSGTAADLFWEAPEKGADLITGYYIVRSNDVDDSELTKRIKFDEGDELTWRDKSIQVGVTYTYEVYSYTEIKKGTYVESEKATKREYLGQLQAPGNLTAESYTTNSIKLTWDEVDGASFYNVYRKKASDSTFPPEPIGTAPKADYPSYIDDKSVNPGYKYMYTVSAVASVTISEDMEDPETGDTIPGVSADYEGPTCDGVLGVTFPSVPTGVSVVEVGDTYIEIKWDNVEGATGYLLYVSDDGENYEMLKEIAGSDNLSYLDEKLEVGQTRFYRLQSYVEFEVAGAQRVVSGKLNAEEAFIDLYSKPVSATTLPLAPEEVELTNPASYDQIKVSWTESIGADGYYILRGTSSKTAPSEIVATVPVESLEDPAKPFWIDDTGLKCGTLYYYRVQPYIYSSVGSTLMVGEASSTVSLKAMPAVPTGLAGELVPYTNTIQLTWDRVEGATGYYVYAAQDGGAFKQLANVKGVTDEVITYVVTGLTLCSEYQFAVAAYRKSGDKTYTGDKCEPIDPIMVEFFAPGVNADGTLNFVAEPQSKSKAKLSWTKVDGATGYELRVFEKTSGSSIYSKKLTSATATLTGLDCDVDYVANLRLYRKVDGVYQYGDETEIEFHTSPAKPSKLTVKVNPDGTGVDLTWAAVSEADGYIVTRSTDKGGADAQMIMTPRVASLGVKFTDMVVEPGMRYYYHVYSYVESSCGANHEAGQPDYAKSKHISVPVTASALHLPGKVTGLAVKGEGATAAVLTWEPVEFADGYSVYQKKGDGSYKLIYEGEVSENGEGLCEYMAEDLTGGSKYTYKVRAYSEAYDGSTAYGAYSSTVSVKPAPYPPASVEAIGSDAKRVYLAWEAAEGATSYKVYYELADGQKKYISTVKSKAEYGEIVTATVKGLAFDQQYTFYVTSGANSVYGEYSDASNPIKTALGVVEDFAYKSSSATKVKLSWTALPDVSGYEIERRGTGENTWALITSPGKDTKSYSAGKMVLGEKEDFRIRGYVKVGSERVYRDDEGWTEIEGVYTLPGKPANFRGASSSYDRLTFKWNEVKGADGYVIFWENKNDPDDNGSWPLKGSDTLEYTITGLEASTTYKVYVRAYVFDPSDENLGTKTATISRKTSKEP